MVKEFILSMRKNNGFGKFDKKRPKGSRPSSDFKKDEEGGDSNSADAGGDKKGSERKSASGEEPKTDNKHDKDLTPEEQAKIFKEKIEKEFERLLNPKKGQEDSQESKKSSKKGKDGQKKKGFDKNTFNFNMGTGNQGPENDPRRADLLKNIRNLGIGMLVFFLLTSGGSENQYENISFDYFENEFLKKG